jgi:hypothetical protein
VHHEDLHLVNRLMMSGPEPIPVLPFSCTNFNVAIQATHATNLSRESSFQAAHGKHEVSLPQIYSFIHIPCVFKSTHTQGHQARPVFP